MGFWHTGYREFHEDSGLEGYVYRPPPPVRYCCDVCAVSFAELEELRRHRFEQHPVRQPALLLRGRAVTARSQPLTTSLQASDIVVQDASRCWLDGRAVELSALGEQLAVLTRKLVEVRLQNDAAMTRYLLDFRIASETDVAGIEAAFIRLARDRVLSIETLSRFIGDCREFASAMSYCDGICHYLYGVMAKERALDSGLVPNRYEERYLRAFERLSGFDRSLAHSIRALIAFHFNHFADAELLAPDGALRSAAGAFAGLLQGLPWHFDAAFSPAPGSAQENLLTDQDTLRILVDASHGVVELTARADALLMNVRRLAGGGYDQMKRMLLTAEALAACDDNGSRAEARKLARELAGRTATEVWAKALLERLSKS